MLLRDRRMSKLEDFGELFQPEEALEPILARPVRNALTDWLTEIWANEELAAVDLKPRRKAHFSGPPGVGKTTLAHHLAARLGLPMLAVRAERLMISFVSASAQAVGALFDVASEAEPHLLFFDEFDSLAQKRMHGGRNATAEADHNHMVNTLLRRFDEYEGVVIAATNVADQIDPAVWRRFEIHIALDLPGQDERERILGRYLAPYVLPKDALSRLAEAFETATPSLMRQFCESLKRSIVIGPKAKWDVSRDGCVSRVLASVLPHPDLGKPRLWTLGLRDKAVTMLPWPLMTKVDQYNDPEIDADEAERMGCDAANCGKAIISNPFPFGDERRPRWDKGWRDEGGNDGMGPSDQPKVVQLRGGGP